MRIPLGTFLILCALILGSEGQGKGRGGKIGKGKGWRRGKGNQETTTPATESTSQGSVGTTSDGPIPTVQPSAADESYSLSDEAKAKIKARCAKIGCKVQSAEAQARRLVIKALRKAEFLELNGLDVLQAEIAAENLLKKIQAAKVAVLEAQGLAQDIVPEDDGLWGKDMALNEKQADQIIKSATERSGRIKQPSEADEPNGPSDDESGEQSKNRDRDQDRDSGQKNKNKGPLRRKNPFEGRRRKRNAMYFEDYDEYKFPLPVPYYIVSGFSNYETQLIYQAISDIEYKTCVRFQQVGDRYPSAHMRFYRYSSSAFCGQSYLGKQAYYNVIYLNMGCSNMMSITVHEILHSLGIDHEQTRQDRDYFVTVNWDNVHGQSYDFFEKSYMYQYTSYGVPYDYYSVMHYSAYAGSQNGLQTMSARYSPVNSNTQAMGSRSNGLSNRDADKVTKMYCKYSCRDNDVFCGHWANTGYCGSNEYVQTNCLKSCYYC